MSPVQCRMARAALGWSLVDLASRAGASQDTVARLERGEDLRDKTVQRFRHQFESAGIIFIDEDKIAGEGVRFTLKSRRRRGKGA